MRNRRLLVWVALAALLCVALGLGVFTWLTARPVAQSDNALRVLPPLSSGVISEANGTDVTIKRTFASAPVNEASAVDAAASRVSRKEMNQVAASLMMLTTGSSGAGETVWAVESRPLPGMTIPVPGGGSAGPPGKSSTTTGPESQPHVVFRLDFVNAYTGAWLQALEVNGP
jgi:hypothetical protein